VQVSSAIPRGAN